MRVIEFEWGSQAKLPKWKSGNLEKRNNLAKWQEVAACSERCSLRTLESSGGFWKKSVMRIRTIHQYFLKNVSQATPIYNQIWKSLLNVVLRPAALYHQGAMESQPYPSLTESESAFQQDLQMVHKHIQVQEALTIENIYHK